MKRASQLFDQQQRQSINMAVAEAESKTSAELVPIVATSSGRYDRPEDIVGLWVGLGAAVIVWAAFPETRMEPGSWGDISPAWKVAAMLAGVIAGFIAGVALATYVGWLRRLFTPRRQMRDEVEQRARSIFFDNRIHRTAGATGLLIYVSLFERMAAVIADDAVTEKLGRTAISDLCAELTGNLRKGQIAPAICRALQSAAERLGAVLPRAAEDVNELPDALVTID
jgi:putative membrane protein